MATKIGIEISAETSRDADHDLEYALKRIGFVRQDYSYERRYDDLVQALAVLGMDALKVLDDANEVRFKRLCSK